MKHGSKRGRYKLQESVRGYCQHLRVQAAGRGGETGADVRARLGAAQADLAAEKVKAMRGQTLPTVEVESRRTKTVAIAVLVNDSQQRCLTDQDADILPTCRQLNRINQPKTRRNRRNHNPRVGGSSPSSATNPINALGLYARTTEPAWVSIWVTRAKVARF